MIHEDGLVSDPAFQTRRAATAGHQLELAFDANSQGGIMGGAATAVAQDWTRAVLGVPGMNYSLLLRRSVDFDTYAAILDPAYPDPVEQTLGISLIQMLWDRAENDGYAQHLTTDPYADTPEHQVLLNVAFGDHQVSMWARRDHGPDHRRRRPRARRWPTAATPTPSPTGASTRSSLPLRRLGPRGLGQRRRGAADHQHARRARASTPTRTRAPTRPTESRSSRSSGTSELIDVCDGAPCTAESVES